MNHCKIVEDLLPLYLDDLTSEETSLYIKQHMGECSACMQQYKRMYTQINQVQNQDALIPDYKKTLKKNIFKIVIRYLSVFILVMAIGIGFTIYIPWELGLLGEKEQITSPNGKRWFEIVDNTNGGFFNRGGAYIQMPVGERNYRGDTSFIDLDVYWASNSEYYFAIWEFTDHTESYYWGANLGLEEESYWNRVYPKEHNFFEVLEKLCRNNENLEIGWDTITFSFIKWSDDSKKMCFYFETNDGQSGFLWYSIEQNEIVEFLTK